MSLENFFGCFGGGLNKNKLILYLLLYNLLFHSAIHYGLPREACHIILVLLTI